MTTRRIFLTTAFLALLTFVFWVPARSIPPLNTDEIIAAVHGYNMLTAQGQRYSLFDTIFAPEIYRLRDSFGEVIRPGFDLWLGMALHLFGKKMVVLRLACAAAGALALWALVLLGGRLGRRSAAVLTGTLALLHPVFWLGASVARPEMLCCATTAVLMLIAIGPDFRWKPFVLGVLGGLQLGIHQLPVFAGVFVLFAFQCRPAKRWQSLGAVVAGVCAGALIVMSRVDLWKFVQAQRLFWGTFFAPPILHPRWNWTHWFGAWMRTLRGETYFFHGELCQLWYGAVLLAWLMIVLGLSLNRHLLRGSTRAVFAALMTVMVLMVVLIPRSDALYGLAVFPFALPLAACGLRDAWIAGGIRRSIAAVGLLGLLLSAIAGAVFAQEYHASYPPMPRWIGQLKALVNQSHPRIVGPNTLWFDFDAAQLRDVGALRFSYWYSGGAWAPEQWLRPWQPTVLVLDDWALKKGVADQTRFGNAAQLTYLGALDTGPGADGIFYVYGVSWNDTAHR